MQQIAITVTEAAEKASISKALIFKLWREGKGPKRIKVGRRTLIKTQDLEAWLDTLGGENHAC